MINIITDCNKDVILSNDSFFYIDRNKKLDNLDKKAIREIDNGIVAEDGSIRTPFGLMGSAEYLSTGVKTIININHNPSKIFTIAECGKNAVSFIFREMADMDITIQASFIIAPSQLIKPCTINGKVVNNLAEYREEWREINDNN